MIDLITSYYNNPVNMWVLDDFDISFTVWNHICGDDITVYIKFDDKKIIWRSFDGHPSMITTASCSFFSELVIWSSIDDVLLMDEKTMTDEWFVASPRRRRAVVIGILATKNAIHKRLEDGIEEGWDDVFVD